MYKRTIWQDHVEGIQEGTDMNAANFNNLEAGVMEAAALADFNATFNRYNHDIAKNGEVIAIKAVILNGPNVETYVAIPKSARRNTSEYMVNIFFEGVDGVEKVIVSDKQPDGFYAKYIGEAVLAKVDFYISGGMI